MTKDELREIATEIAKEAETFEMMTFRRDLVDLICERFDDETIVSLEEILAATSSHQSASESRDSGEEWR